VSDPLDMKRRICSCQLPMPSVMELQWVCETCGHRECAEVDVERIIHTAEASALRRAEVEFNRRFARGDERWPFADWLRAEADRAERGE